MINQTTGKYLIFFGIILVFLGVVLFFFHDKMSWVGNLPGDIRIENENSKIYLPFATMILVSIIVNVILYIFRRIS
ncbi:MAG: putative membrane protein [Spirosomataceae bacterium]|jgi:uncharacterized membrane protein